MKNFSDMLFPAGKDMFKVNNSNTRTRCETCSNLTKISFM